MKFSDALLLALSNLRRTKFRSFLTISGVVIGIGSILLLVSLGVGLEKITTNQIADMDTLLTLSVTQKSATAIMEEGSKIDDKTIAQIQKINGVVTVSPIINIPTANITVNNTSSEAIIVGIKKDFLKTEITKYTSGKEMSADTDMILSSQLAEAITSKPDELIGKDVKIKITKVEDKVNADTGSLTSVQEVSGKVSGIEEGQAGNLIYVPLDMVIGQGNTSGYSSLKVKVANRSDIDTVNDEIKKMGYEVTTVKELIDQVTKVFLIIQIVLAMFGAIGLFVATLGIINTMTISLIERIREIGIMKAIGASNSDIRRLFMFESALIGLFGGLLGVGSSYLVGTLFNAVIKVFMTNSNQAPMDIFAFSVPFSAIMVIFSVFIAVFAGIYPAIRAQKLEPLKALYQR